MGAATLLDLELQRWNIQLTGLQEVRWPDIGTKNVSDTTSLWSGRKDGCHREGVALAIHRKLMTMCVSWIPVDECNLSARFRHTASHISVVAYAPTECADRQTKEDFYTRVVRSCGKRDLKVILGDCNAVSGIARLQGDTVLGPWGSSSPNKNSGFLLSFCRGCQLSISGSWFQRKDIYRHSWTSNDRHSQKEIDHELLS